MRRSTAASLSERFPHLNTRRATRVAKRPRLLATTPAYLPRPCAIRSLVKRVSNACLAARRRIACLLSDQRHSCVDRSSMLPCVHSRRRRTLSFLNTPPLPAMKPLWDGGPHARERQTERLVRAGAQEIGGA